LLKQINSYTNPHIIVNLNTKYKLNLQYIDGLLYNIINKDSIILSKKLEGLPHIHCLLCFDFFKSILFNNISLQQELYKLFPLLDINVKFIKPNLINYCNSLNYIFKNIKAIDNDYNLSTFSSISSKSFYVFNNKLYLHMFQYIVYYKQINIFFIFKQNLYNNEFFYSSNERLHLCANEILSFLFSNTNAIFTFNKSPLIEFKIW
jgi:hypothetical protein